MILWQFCILDFLPSKFVKIIDSELQEFKFGKHQFFYLRQRNFHSPTDSPSTCFLAPKIAQKRHAYFESNKMCPDFKLMVWMVLGFGQRTECKYQVTDFVSKSSPEQRSRSAKMYLMFFNGQSQPNGLLKSSSLQ